MFTLERATSERRVRLSTLVGLVLVPLVIAGGFLWATWNSGERLGRVQAAVVNLDQAVTLDKQVVPLGRQLAGGLVASKESQNFSWVLTDQADAASGLASGRYAAVVTIPKGFSADATSYSHPDAGTVRPATLDVQTSQVAGIADPVVGQEIAAVATRQLNSQLTEGYLKNVYVGFNTLNKQFATVADAAGQLATGSRDLAKGIGSASDGTTALARGLHKLDTGATSVSDGTDKLSRGVGSLSAGLDKLATGTQKLPSQTRRLANGAGDAADGAAKLARGATKLDAGLPALTAGTTASAAGAKMFARGVSDYRDGVRTYASGADRYVAGLQQYRSAIKKLSRTSPTGLATLVPCPDQIAAGGDAACQVFYGGLQAGVQVGTGAALQGLADQHVHGRTQPGLLTGAKGLASGADQLSHGAGRLSDGADQLSSGARRLHTGAKRIAGGVDGLSGGISRLSGGLGTLSDGTDRLARGTKALSSGISAAAGGADQLQTGAAKLADGARQLADGTQKSATGADKLSAGLVKLSDGGDKLSDGTKKLADGLKKGADQVPTYDRSEREKLSSVVATPVSSEPPASAFGDVATTTFLAVIALWVGALAVYVVLRAVSARVLTSMRPSWWIAGVGLLPGVVAAVVQAAALTGVLALLLDLSGARTGRLLPFAVLSGLAFVAVNHALVAWFGGVGRFVSVVLVVLAAAGAITSAVPRLFDAVQPFLPLSPALAGFRAIVTGGTGTGAAVGLLLAWLVVGLAASVLAVARRRVVSPLAGPSVVLP